MQRFLACLFLLMGVAASGFDALRLGPVPFAGTVKPPVPGFYRLRLISENGLVEEEVAFEKELFCTAFSLPGKKPKQVQWILTQNNFFPIPADYRKSYPLDEKLMRDPGFGEPETVSAKSDGKQMIVTHFVPDFEDRNSFALRIVTDFPGELFLNGKSLGIVPAGKPWLVRIPWWEMRSLPSRLVLVTAAPGKVVLEHSRLHGVRFLNPEKSGGNEENWPRAVIGTLLKVELAMPDANRGFYRGCRFQAAGMVTDFPGFGRNFLPRLRDPRNHSDAAGQAEEFVEPPDFTAPYDVFMKIGVGLLYKTGTHYFQQKNYRVERFFPWRCEVSVETATFQQQGRAPSGYAYVLTKKITVRDNTLAIDYELENTGVHILVTHEYAHNFLIPGTVIFPDRTFPDRLETALTEMKGAMQGRAELVARDVRLELWESGPVDKRALFQSDLSVSPEFFRSISLAPGQKMCWRRMYTVRKTTD